MLFYQQKKCQYGLAFDGRVHRKSFRANFSDPNTFLIMDDFKAHRKAQVNQKLNSLQISHEIIPGGLTSSLQPLDVSLKKPFKDYYREEWNTTIDSPNPIYTKGGNRQKTLSKMIMI